MLTEKQRELFLLMGEMRRVMIWDLLPDTTPGEMRTLAAIRICRERTEDGKVKVSDICESLHHPAPAVSRMLRRLEENGCIERTTDPQDRRNTLVRMTEKGRQTELEGARLMKRYLDGVFSRLGAEEVDETIAHLRKMLDAMHAASSGLKEEREAARGQVRSAGGSHESEADW